LLSPWADDDDMEPLDPRSRGENLPPPVDSGASAAAVVTRAEITIQQPVSALVSPSSAPKWTTVPPNSSPGQEVGRQRVSLLAMAPWRFAAALTMAGVFAFMGWQVRRLVGDQPWSDPLMWTTIVVGVASAICVLGWTWCATENARRLVEPAVRDHVPDPNAATLAWIAPFAFVAVAAGVLAALGTRAGVGDARSVQALPLAVASVALLSAILSMYRPLHHVARAVRQVGGYSVRLAQWLWVPVVMGLVGIASIAALRFAGFDDTDASSTVSTGTTDPRGWAPLWMIAVVAIAPCIVTVLLAWRAASSVEDAVTVAASRRRVGAAMAVPRAEHAPSQPRVASRDLSERIKVLPGADTLRLAMVTFLAGAALLSLVGAGLVGLLWFDSRDTGVLPVQRQRAWDALEALEVASRGVTIALIAAVSAWTFVIVLNIRMTSGRRRNPVIATLAWPAAAGAIWWIADRVVADASVRAVMVGFAAQAAVLAVPLLLLERSAATIGARRTPLRIVYALGVVLLVHVQGLGGLSNFPDAVTTAAVGRLAGFLMVGALIQLCSTLAVTEACRTMSQACRHEADHHNMLVAQISTPRTAGQGRGGRRRESVARR